MKNNLELVPTSSFVIPMEIRLNKESRGTKATPHRVRFHENEFLFSRNLKLVFSPGILLLVAVCSRERVYFSLGHSLPC